MIRGILILAVIGHAAHAAEIYRNTADGESAIIVNRDQTGAETVLVKQKGGTVSRIKLEKLQERFLDAELVDLNSDGREEICLHFEWGAGSIRSLAVEIGADGGLRAIIDVIDHQRVNFMSKTPQSNICACMFDAVGEKISVIKIWHIVNSTNASPWNAVEISGK